MTIRVRPADVEVPPDDPFQNDLLDRKPSIETLTGLLGALEGPCVLALDSEWGGGKTTFIKLWAAHLRNEGFAVAEFNAWETDFSGDPFVALSSKLQLQFEAAPSDKFAGTTEHFAKAVKRVALRTAPVAIRILSQGLLESGSLEQLFTEQVVSYAENRLEEFDEVQKSVIDFKEVLQEGALRLSEQHDNRALFIMIDELDRCRPSYAVELLEVAKHLFSVDRIVFVLALNRSELAHSVQALYGRKFDAKGYLHRFFDLDYSLPWPDREKFVMEALQNSGLGALFLSASEPFQVVPSLIARLMAWSDLDLRRIGQTTRRMALACASLGDTFPGVTTGLCVACVLRALDSKLYQHLRDGDTPDMNIIGQLYEIGNLKNLQYTPESCMLEASISAMWCALRGGGQRDADVFSNSPHIRNCISTRDGLEQRSRELGPREGLTQEERTTLAHKFGVVNAAAILQNVGNYRVYSSVIWHIELVPSDEAIGVSE